MMRDRVLWISVCLCASAAAAGAQERLTLGDATERAIARNHAIRIEREGIAAADARELSAQGEYDLQMRADVGLRHWSDPTTSLLSGAPNGELSATQNSIGSTFSITQLFKSGATASLWASASREGTNSTLSLFQPAYFTSLGVDLRQPLLRNRANDPARTALRVTALDRDRSSAALTRQVLQTVSQVETAYWTLVAARRDLNVRRDTLALAEAQRVDTQVRIDARTLAESDLAQPTAEVERRRGDLFAAEEAVARAERELKALIAGSPTDSLWTIDIVPADRPGAAPIAYDLRTALADAAVLRPEIADANAQIAQQREAVSLAQDALKPQLDLVAGYATRGLAGSQNAAALPLGGLPLAIPATLTGSAATSYRTLAEQRYPDARIGVSFELPLGRREARGQLGAAEAAQRQATEALAQTEERIAVEVRNAATALETAAGRIEAARAGLVAAETQLRAEQDRFGAGLSTNFFVLTRQNDLAQAQLAETSALVDYEKAATELGRATGTLLRNRGIRIN